MKDKTTLFQTIRLLGLTVAIAMLTSTTGLMMQQTIVVYASMGSESEGGGGSDNSDSESNIQSSSQENGCSTTPATDPELEGWTIETCGNGDQTWISPHGTKCVANEGTDVLACDDMQTMKGLQGGSKP
jgi:hypothetical protein